MDYSSERNEHIVLGKLLNDTSMYGLMGKYRMSLRRELFKNKQNKFIYGIIEDMHKDGLVSFSPYDVLLYADKKNVIYGDRKRFAIYMVEISCEFHSVKEFAKSLNSLVKTFIKDKQTYG